MAKVASSSRQQQLKKPSLRPFIEGPHERRPESIRIDRLGLDRKLPELDQLDYRLRTTFDIQFLHYVRDVVPDGLLADEQLLGNVASCFVLHEQFEHLAFPIREQELALVIAACQRVSPLLARAGIKLQGIGIQSTLSYVRVFRTVRCRLKMG